MIKKFIRNLLISIKEFFKTKKEIPIFIHKTHPKAVIPTVAYDGTSLAFDLTSVRKTTIPAGESRKVPVGLNITIPSTEPYGMVISLRSKYGFSKDLIPHYGDVDAGYTGDFGVKVYNVGKKDVVIPSGERFAQVKIFPKIPFKFIELDDENWEKFKSQQIRGDGGFGSSDKIELEEKS